MNHIPVEQQTRLDSIRQWCDTLIQRAERFEQQGDDAVLKHIQIQLYNLWLEINPTYSIGINGPPETSMGSTAMTERKEQS